MPWGDGTGPLGLGPMTGRGLGYCAGYSTPGWTKTWGGRGFRNWYYLTGLPGWIRANLGLPAFRTFGVFPNLTQENEKQILENQIKILENQLEILKERLKEIGSKNKSKKD